MLLLNLLATLGVVKGDCFETDVNFHGNDIGFDDQETPADCQAACAADPNCVVFTFVPTIKRCYRKDSDAGRENKAPFISGPWQCPGDCLETDTNIMGNDIGFTELDSAEDCQAACAEDSACKFFTYVTSNRRCFRKTSDANKSDFVGMISGPKACALASRSITACNDHDTSKRCKEQVTPECTWDGKLENGFGGCLDASEPCKKFKLKWNCVKDGNCIYDNKVCYEKSKVTCPQLVRKANCLEMGCNHTPEGCLTPEI